VGRKGLGRGMTVTIGADVVSGWGKRKGNVEEADQTIKPFTSLSDLRVNTVQELLCS